MIMSKKYLVSFYLVENDVWKYHFSYTIDSYDLPQTLQSFRARGYIQKEKNNLYIKTFYSDVDATYLVYTVVELPIKL